MENIQQIIEGFFTKLCIDCRELEIKEEAENIYAISLKSDDSGILIGQKGKNLEDIKSILRSMLSRKTEKHIIVHLEVNDYLQEKEQRLIEMVQQKIDAVKKSGQDIRLPFLSSYERKKVHAYVSELADPKIFTKSEGEGEERRLYICKKDAKITIDADSIDI